MKSPLGKITLVFCIAAFASLSQAAFAAQGYTLRIKLDNEAVDAFTVEKVSNSNTAFNSDGSTSFDTKVSSSETGSYNFTHRAGDKCAGNYKINILGDGGAAIAECKVSWSSQSDPTGCTNPFWEAASCKASNDSGVSFDRTSKGSHHGDYTLQ